MREQKLGVILSYINLAITNITGILITPYTIKMLGPSEYGLYSLIGAFVGYLSVLDLGLNDTIVRYVAKYRVEENKKEEENFIAVSFILYIVIGVLLVIVGSFFYFSIDDFFKSTLTTVEIEKAKIMVLILLFNLAITIPGGALVGICSGYKRFVFPRFLTIIKYVVRVILLCLILYMGSKAIGIVILDTLLNLVFILISIYFVFFKLKVTFKLYELKIPYIKEIFSYSIWVFLYALTFQFQWRSGQFVIGTNSNTTSVAIFAIGVMLGVYFTTFGNLINGVLLPKAVESIGQGITNQQLTKQLIRVGRLSMVILLFILCGFLLLGREFVYLWIGKLYSQAFEIAALIMIVYLIPLTQGYTHSILQAKNLHRVKSILFFIFTIFGVLLGKFLSNHHGIVGMIIGIASGFLLLHVLLNFYYHFKLGINMLTFFRKGILPFVFPFCIIYGLNYYLISYLEVSWSLFFVKGIIYACCYAVLIYFVVLTKEEKDFFKKTIKIIK